MTNCNYAALDVTAVGHVDPLLLLPQGFVGWHYLLSFHKGWSSVPYTKEDKKHWGHLSFSI